MQDTNTFPFHIIFNCKNISLKKETLLYVIVYIFFKPKFILCAVRRPGNEATNLMYK